LDDIETRHETFKKKFNLPIDTTTHTYTSKDCIHELTNYEFDMISLGNGYDVCEWLVNNKDRVPNIVIIHTPDSIMSHKMFEYLGRCNIRSVRNPGYWYD
jgi:hypothetical protein